MRVSGGEYIEGERSVNWRNNLGTAGRKRPRLYRGARKAPEKWPTRAGEFTRGRPPRM